METHIKKAMLPKTLGVVLLSWDFEAFFLVALLPLLNVVIFCAGPAAIFLGWKRRRDAKKIHTLSLR
jgi:hypothetical protein